jgi:tetratricopeptide (TPR) repeat protein
MLMNKCFHLKLRIMKKLMLIAMIAWVAGACNPSREDAGMTVTTNSETARGLYLDAITALEDAYVAKFQNLATAALKEDPDFFMVNFQLAITHLYFGNMSRFNEYATAGINCKADLSKEELLLKDALERIMENQITDLPDIGKKLIQDFPNDINAYNIMGFFLILNKDYDGLIQILSDAVVVAERPAPLYNMLGYAYMETQQFELAEEAFDKYIELAPGIPNPYDSKGDYYMEIKDYKMAYDSFMKAYEIDSLWGYEKAMNAKIIADNISE